MAQGAYSYQQGLTDLQLHLPPGRWIRVPIVNSHEPSKKDPTAAAIVKERNGYETAMVNFRFLAGAIWTTGPNRGTVVRNPGYRDRVMPGRGSAFVGPTPRQLAPWRTEDVDQLQGA